MPPTNANDPLHTTDQVPNAAQSGPDVTTDHSPDSPPSDRATATHLPGQSVKLKGTEPEPGPGSVSIPGYEIEEVLGRGGMGVVYKARHLALKRTVALKLMLAGGHAGPRELARFRIEAEAVARLQHPNIVQIHEVGEADGHPYCALEFVAGGNLASKLGGKPLPAKEAAKQVEALARAMQLAHSRNVVHRDLKPANVLLTAEGTPKITDFGLARQLDSDSGETQAGQVMGTPSYMAPEQASGRAHEAGPAADVYALGAILYDCVAGRPPFKGKTVVEMLDQVRTQEPAPPSRWRTGVPLDLDTICLKCLRKEPEKRYASAAELADELVRYQRGEPILARPVGRIERAVKWVRRNPVVTGAAVAVVLALAAGTTVSYLSLKGHTCSVMSVAFSLDGKRISGKDGFGKVLTWNAMTGQLLPAADPMPQEQKTEATSPDGSLRAFIENSLRGGELTVVRLPDFIEEQKRERGFLERLARSVPGYHYEKADLYEKSGDHFASAFHLRRLLAVRPSYALLLLRREPFNQRAHSAALGVAALDAAIVQEPKNAALWLRRGLFRSRQGSPEAQADLDRAIELSRADTALMLARSLLEARAGRPAQARSLQKQALGQTALPALDAERGWERRPRTAPLLQGPAADAADTLLALEEELGWERRVGPLQVARAFAAGGSVSGPWSAALTLALGPRSAQEPAPAWRWCGLARCARGEWGRAIHDLDAALMLSPGDLVARRCRARAHVELLQWDRASADCTTCLKVQPNDWELWYLRALAYREMNRPDLALSDLTRALAQGGDGLALREALPLYRRLAAPYRAHAARLTYDRKQFAAATQLWAEALASDPKLGDDRQTQHCYNAACAAALAAAGQGKEEPPPDDATKSKLRRQALDWLKAELAAWGKLLESGQPGIIVQTLSHWQKDTDLAGIRDQAALAKLPAEEQKAFTRLWADVATLLKKAGEKAK